MNVMFPDFLFEHLRKVRFNHTGLYSWRQSEEAQAFWGIMVKTMRED